MTDQRTPADKARENIDHFLRIRYRERYLRSAIHDLEAALRCTDKPSRQHRRLKLLVESAKLCALDDNEAWMRTDTAMTDVWTHWFESREKMRESKP